MNMLKDFLHYTRSERSGILVLVALCLAVLVVRRILPRYLQPAKIEAPELQSFAASAYTGGHENKPARSAGTSRPDSIPPDAKQPVPSVPPAQQFDPNTATAEELLRHQLPERVVRTLINYRQKGGQFRQSQDLLRVYGMTEEHYQRIAPYIEIADLKAATSLRSRGPRATNLEVDINLSSAEQWMELHGIGPGYSRRILNFRNKLGGFSSVQQVADTYGLPDSTFQSIKEYLRVSPLLRKLPVNSLDADSLASHPYISFRQARAIVNYRRNHGYFKGPEDFRKILIMKPAEHDRLLPYLHFD